MLESIDANWSTWQEKGQEIFAKDATISDRTVETVSALINKLSLIYRVIDHE
jgi:hypothetical protein